MYRHGDEKYRGNYSMKVAMALGSGILLYSVKRFIV